MHICFYNIAHIGDIYFSSFFISLICKSNPNINFLYYFLNADIFLENIPNIHRINNIQDNEYKQEYINGSPPECLIDDTIILLLLQNNMRVSGGARLNINNRDILFVNTWGNSEFLKHDDYNLPDTVISYTNLISKINNEFGLNLHFHLNNIIDINEHIPKPRTLPKKIENIENTIFIFNFIPRSISTNDAETIINNLKRTIFELSKTHQVLLSSFEPVFYDFPNITYIDKTYGIKPTVSCENLLTIWGIALQCKKIILLETGSSWTFFHSLKSIQENQLYMFNSTNGQKYCDKLNTMINTLLGEEKNLINMFTYENVL